MTHPLNMPHVAGVRCSDLPTPGEWLRALAGNLALIRTWWAVPMVCRGEFTTGASCSVRRRRPPMAPKVVVQWTAPRRRVMTSVRISTSGYVACFDPKVTS